MSDQYNGWTNRETWAVNLHLSSRIGFYDEVLDRIRKATEPRRMASAVIQQWMESRLELVFEGKASPETRRMILDIGSLWRVNWDEVAAALAEGNK